MHLVKSYSPLCKAYLVPALTYNDHPTISSTANNSFIYSFSIISVLTTQQSNWVFIALTVSNDANTMCVLLHCSPVSYYATYQAAQQPARAQHTRKSRLTVGYYCNQNQFTYTLLCSDASLW